MRQTESSYQLTHYIKYATLSITAFETVMLSVIFISVLVLRVTNNPIMPSVMMLSVVLSVVAQFLGQMS